MPVKLRQTGFSLTELMVGSTVALIVLSGAIQLYTINIRASNDSLQLSRLSHDTRSMLSIMERELLRSGYWSFSPEHTLIQGNPFTQQKAYLTIDAKAEEADNSCILYSYDRYQDGLIGVGGSGHLTASTTRDNVEQFGFRLNDGRLQMRQSGANFSCNSGRWQTMNEESILIDTLHFERHTHCTHAQKPASDCSDDEPGWLHTRIDIRLSASLASTPNIQQTQSTSVDIRNDQWLANR